MGAAVTVILPNRDHGRFLAQAIRSVCTQSLAPARVIVIDDDSTDDSVAVVEGLMPLFPMLELRRNAEACGPLANFNDLLPEIDTPYVYFGASDDFVLPGLFAAAAEALERFPQAAFAAGLVKQVDAEGADLLMPPEDGGEAMFLPPGAVLARLMAKGSFVTGNGVVHRTSALREYGGFPTDLGSFGDGYVYEAQGLAHGCCLIPRVLAVWRRMEGGLSSTMGRSVDQLLAVGERALQRMAGRDAARFPPAYRRMFATRWRYAAALAALQQDDGALAARAAGLNAVEAKALALLIAGPGKRAAPAALLLRMLPRQGFAVALGKLFKP